MENKKVEQSPITEEFVPLNIEKVKNLIPTFSSEKLCEMIACGRYFSLDQNIIIACMEELSARRTSGSSFEFENYIEEAYSKLPVLNFNIPDLRTTLSRIIKTHKK